MEGSVTDEQAHRWLQEISQAGYVSLHFDNPGLGGEEHAEIGGGGYKRYKMAWSQPNNRAIWSLEDARFTGLVQTKVTYFGVWSRANPGDLDFLRAYAELDEPRVVLSGKGLVLPRQMLVISFG